jgi:hypothetical protein
VEVVFVVVVILPDADVDVGFNEETAANDSLYDVNNPIDKSKAMIDNIEMTSK